MSVLNRLFTAHPEAVGESYFEHLVFAWRFAGRLFRASLAAFIHGVVPAACEATASSTVLGMANELSARRRAYESSAAL
jgi:hypothetical protein